MCFRNLKNPEINYHKLSRRFYRQPTLKVAQLLLGKLLVRKYEGVNLTGRIVETEAYCGSDDAASHAAGGKTSRNAVMFGPPGFAYVYFIYGKYNCLNFVTEPEGIPAAVLIRAIEPMHGINAMRKLRDKTKITELASGPGKLCQAFAIDKVFNQADLLYDTLFVAEGDNIQEKDIVAARRVGIKSATENLWRFYILNNPHVSVKN